MYKGECHCLRCGYLWFTKLADRPVRCARCRSRYWNRPRERALYTTDRRLADVRDGPLLPVLGGRRYVERRMAAPRVSRWPRARSGW